MPHSPHPVSLSPILKHSILLLTVLCVLSWSPAVAATANLDPEQVKIQATTLIEEIIQGISEGDYGMYSSHFSKPMKESQTRENFLDLQRRLQKAVGKFQSVQYLGFYNQYGNVITLFKARFSKEKDDVLIRLVMEGYGADAKVTGLWFDSPALEK